MKTNSNNVFPPPVEMDEFNEDDKILNFRSTSENKEGYQKPQYGIKVKEIINKPVGNLNERNQK
jgi:hypothetical protein